MLHRSLDLVGRDRELAVVRRAVADACAGRGGVLFISGESGIGKTRLAGAAVDLGFSGGMALMRGRASSIGIMTPFRPLTEAVLSLLRTEDVDPTALGPYRSILGRLVPDWSDASGSADGESLVVLAEGVLRLTGMVGRGRGCLLSLDDLEEADPETLTVLEYLVDNVDMQSTLLVASVRDESCPALALARTATRRGRGTLLELGRLGVDDLRSLAADCLETTPELVPDEAVALLWSGSAGNPSVAQELVTTMVDDGVLTAGRSGWSYVQGVESLSSGLARPMARRVAALAAPTRELLSAAATFGTRFPLAVVQHVTGLDDRDLLGLLQAAVSGQLVAPDEQTPDWYSFHHELGRDAVLAGVEPAERARLAAALADATAVLHPGRPGAWCEIAARLRFDAGDRVEAGRLFAEAGKRALALGAAPSAITLLDRAWALLAQADAPSRAKALESLVFALIEAGQTDRALALTDTVDRFAELGASTRALLHTRLAWAAAVAGHTTAAQEQVEAARALAGAGGGAAEDTAQIDVVAAHLALDRPDPGKLAEAERLARQAAEVAEKVPLPVVACQAWQLLGAIVRHRDPAAATTCLDRARSIAVTHNLPMWEIHALIRLGNDDALHHGDVDRLRRAREQATRVGAVTARYQAEASIALHSILGGELDAAAELLDGVEAATARLRLMETTQYATLLRAVLGGHRGDRVELEAAVARFAQRGGDVGMSAPRIDGLAGSFCSLLEEDHPRALADLDRVAAAEAAGAAALHLSGTRGLRTLLRVLAGDAGRAELSATAGEPARMLRWDRQFVVLTDAVLLGREGRFDAAERAVGEALAVAEPYAMSRHLGLRLVGEAAATDGWGDATSWLRTAEDWFHHAGITAVSGACRAILRRTGARVPQRRTGTDTIPAQLRVNGITAREYEVLALLVGRLGNKEIADRLHLSPRTVERHIASLMTKTGLPNRIALGSFAEPYVGS